MKIVKPMSVEGLSKFLRDKDTPPLDWMKELGLSHLKLDLEEAGMTIHPDHDSVFMEDKNLGCKSLNPEFWDLNQIYSIILCYGKENFAFCSLSGEVDKSFKFFIW